MIPLQLAHQAEQDLGSTGLARLLGGDVVIDESHVGCGSTFVTWLPPRTPDTPARMLPGA